MLRVLGIVAIVSAGIFAAALVGLMVGYSWQTSGQETHEQNPAENKPEQYNRENEKPFWQKATSDPVAAFTLWLAVFTAVLGAASILQLASLNRAEVTSAKAADAAKDSADAANRAVTVALHGQRAWISIEGAGHTGITWDEMGARLSVYLTIKNVGPTPATAIHAEAKAFLPKVGESVIPIAAMQDFAADIERRRGNSDQTGDVYFPGQPYPAGFGILFERAEIAALLEATKMKEVVPRIIVCVSYRVNSEPTYRKTCSSYYVTIKKPGTPPDTFFGLAPDQVVPADQVSIGTAFYSIAD